MSFQVCPERRPNTMGLDDTVIVLSNTDSGSQAEVWPAVGFNCYRWHAPWKGQVLDLLYADPQLFTGARATRSGIPILFPFPNRIRDGRFFWQEKAYPLPLNDPVKQNAIHGFTPFRPWRVVDQGADTHAAWVTGEFLGSLDAPDSRDLWPADYAIRVTYRLMEQSLRVEATVTNPDRAALPFGLGYHPYFRLPFSPGRPEEDSQVDCSAEKYWPLENNLPSGPPVPVTEDKDLRAGRSCAGLNLDDVFTALPGSSSEGLIRRAGLRQISNNVALEVWTSPAFREAVLFTPPHRQAICIEPYTCTTDAINLQQHGIDAGLIELQPGGQWQGTVEFRVR